MNKNLIYKGIIPFIFILLLCFTLSNAKYFYKNTEIENYDVINLTDIEFMNIEDKEYYDYFTEKIVEKILYHIMENCHYKYKCLLYEFNNLTNKYLKSIGIYKYNIISNNYNDNLQSILFSKYFYKIVDNRVVIYEFNCLFSPVYRYITKMCEFNTTCIKEQVYDYSSFLFV